MELIGNERIINAIRQTERAEDRITNRSGVIRKVGREWSIWLEFTPACP